jgi:hypothetical protein
MSIIVGVGVDVTITLTMSWWSFFVLMSIIVGVGVDVTITGVIGDLIRHMWIRLGWEYHME